MSDIAFLLLIFIMLLSLINNRKEIKIDYPEAEKYYENAISLPMFSGLSEKAQDHVIDTLREILH